jgi:hypothetical protein
MTVAPVLISARSQCANRAAMMPRRRRTHAENRAKYIGAERRRNRLAREPADRVPIVANDEPPPF